MNILIPSTLKKTYRFNFKQSLYTLFFLSIIALPLSVISSEWTTEQFHVLIQHDTNLQGGDLPPLSAEQIDHIHQNWHQVVDIQPNKLGALRLQQDLESNGDTLTTLEYAQTPAEEFTTTVGSAPSATSLTPPPSTSTLPRHVDNSHWPSFPPIGNQGQLGSCVAWASTYYQASHEKGMLVGTNNKTSLAGVFSPKWTYDILNGGQNNGLNILNAYQLLAQNGIVSLVNFPYDTNYLAWDLNPQDWVLALSNRTAQPQFLAGLGGSQPQNLQAIKQSLANGHVLTFGTYIESWIFTVAKVDPASTTNPYAGQYAASWANGRTGGHMMTIIGYDDDIWIDINSNGKVDPGEKGAFLIANSWSTQWGNQGFIWIAYDAFLATSAVQNGPANGRVAIAEVTNSYAISAIPLAANYSPKLVAQFSLTESLRDQVDVSAGISSTAVSKPAQTFNAIAFTNQGGNYEFNGSTASAPETATFALDLTDLFTNAGTANQRFYLLVSDDKAGNPTILNSFTLIDRVHNTQVSYGQTPITIDNSSTAPFIDYDFANAKAIDDVPPTVAITSPVNGTTVSGIINYIAKATDNIAIARVDFYVDSTLVVSDKTLPYMATVNTKTLSNGSHVLTAIAYDAGNNSAQSKITVIVKN